MGKIIDLAEFDKPREKAIRFGIDSLSDDELLALIINSGTVGHSSLDIARDLLLDCHYLSELTNKPESYFLSFRGLKRAKAIKLMAALEIAKRVNQKQHLIYEANSEVTSESLYKRFSLVLSRQTQEIMIIIILNKNKQIVYEKNLYQGDDGNIVVNTRDILRLLMIHNGYYFYLLHNHPNGTLFPSELDVNFTKRIKQKAKQINIQLIDHLIINQNGYYSFLHQRLINEIEK